MFEWIVFTKMPPTILDLFICLYCLYIYILNCTTTLAFNIHTFFNTFHVLIKSIINLSQVVLVCSNLCMLVRSNSRNHCLFRGPQGGDDKQLENNYFCRNQKAILYYRKLQRFFVGPNRLPMLLCGPKATYFY